MLGETNTKNKELSFRITKNTVRVHYKHQLANTVYGNCRSFRSAPFETHKQIVWTNCGVGL